MNKFLKELIERYPQLNIISEDVEKAIEVIVDCYKSGGKLLLCGNGGSAADCGHIVGELMKGFLKHRPTGSNDEVISKLQSGLPAVSLCESSALFTAFCNDVDPNLVFAQQVYALGKPNDILIGITTSGNSKNVVAAAHTAKQIGMKVIGLVGGDGGKMNLESDIALIVPEKETFKVQELHIAVYHCICAAVEGNFYYE
ncbi:MAG: SIS domain-containing protein [Clostridia bacterium]|nr:SIS domain-containing protein [Clostridia bacterium]